MEIKKIVLAYSGGLDTSVILKWLKEKYNCEVITLQLILGKVKKLNLQDRRQNNMVLNKFL